MATIDEIMKTAQQLGKLIGEHESAVKLQKVMEAFRQDIDAQRLLTDYQRYVAKLGEKEAKGQPIEVEDKRKLDSMQKAVITNPKLRDLQIAQMDYLDLMRRVDEMIAGEAAPEPLGADLGENPPGLAGGMGMG